MMGLAYILSLCSEADAFIASSFQSTFSTASLVAFLVYGPMVDIKNMFMMLATFKTKFVIVVTVTVTLLFMQAHYSFMRWGGRLCFEHIY